MILGRTSNILVIIVPSFSGVDHQSFSISTPLNNDGPIVGACIGVRGLQCIKQSQVEMGWELVKQ